MNHRLGNRLFFLIGLCYGMSVEGKREDGLERETTLELDNRGLTQLSELYSEAEFVVPTNVDPHELYTQDMAGIVLRIVEHEGPIYDEEIVTRVRTLWSKGRAGSRIHGAVTRAIRALETNKSCVTVDRCVMVPTVRYVLEIEQMSPHRR